MVRRYSGYDEYEGVFGPLGTYGAPSGTRQHHHSRRRNGVLDASAQSERGRFLAERRARRRLRAFHVDNDSEIDSEREGAEPLELQPQVSATQAPQHQVWLPTRNFSFRQRAGKLDTRAIARLDLERIVATTDIDAIQRHLENLAFADVTIDDVQHYSDAYFLKLFQIAQLTLEYLLNVQDSLVSHSESIETQCEQLLEECRQLETENGAFEAEIAGLKKDIRHKQRTMATFEVMLLNASASQRRSALARALPGVIDKENAAAEANTVVDSLLGSAEEQDEGVISRPVDCVVCGKRFLSAEYLIRHQQRKHQSERKTKKQSRKAKRAGDPSQRSSSPSSSSSDSSKKKRSRGAKTAPLPVEVAKALEEKNELAKQLIQLQEQMQQEKAARAAQTTLLEHQQSQLTSQVAGSMSKLQEMLLAIETKQEATKQDIMQYTQSTIARLQTEAANAHVLKNKPGASSSRVGKIESDEDEDTSAAKKPKGDADRSAAWQEAQLEKMLEVFFKAQAQQQQEIDALAQENSKLWSKKHRKKCHRQSAEPSALMQMAALDAQRFGVDTGALEREALVSSVRVSPVERLALQEDKLVQTDEEEAASKERATLITQEVQTDVELAAPATATPTPAPASAAPKTKEPPVRRNAVGEREPAQPKQAEAEAKPAIRPDPPTEKQEKSSVMLELEENDKDTRLQHAAHVVGKVALGFLARRRLKNPANWLISLPLTALEAALSDEERSALRRSIGGATQELAVEVELGMTANELRLEIARALSGKIDSGDDDSASIDYHRVLLHHSETREELHGDRPVHSLRDKMEVEVVPFCQAAEEHVDSVVAFHGDVTARLKDVRRASMQLMAKSDECLVEPQLRRLVRLQAHVRRFLAKRRVATARIDRLVEMRILRMREAASRRRSTAADEHGDASSSTGTSSPLLSDPVVAKQCQKVHERLNSAIKAKLAPDSAKSSTDRMSADALAQQLRVLEHERSKLPAGVQERIRSLQTRLERMMLTEYDPEHARALERQNEVAVTIQSAVHVATARRRLQTLLARDSEGRAEVADAESRESGHQSPPLSPLSALSDASSSQMPAASARRDDSERLDDFDDAEIEKLADAYEEGGARVSTEGRARVSTEGGPRTNDSEVGAPTTPPSTERPSTPPVVVAEKKPAARRSMPLPPKLTPTPHSEPRPSTPTVEAAEPGRSPRPTLQDREIISPFSKTPLLSRRSGQTTRRGTGYDNAR